jgi:hypothetical protein
MITDGPYLESKGAHRWDLGDHRARPGRGAEVEAQGAAVTTLPIEVRPFQDVPPF